MGLPRLLSAGPAQDGVPPPNVCCIRRRLFLRLLDDDYMRTTVAVAVAAPLQSQPLQPPSGARVYYLRVDVWTMRR